MRLEQNEQGREWQELRLKSTEATSHGTFQAIARALDFLLREKGTSHWRLLRRGGTQSDFGFKKYHLLDGK